MRRSMPSTRLIHAFSAFIFFVWHMNATAQISALQIAEPKRFALVIGNADYGRTVGSLPPLGSPCNDDDTRESDAKVIAEALASSQWAVRKLCNLTTTQLRDAISDFNDQVLTEPRAFGIIYFSGHGAQVAGTNYLFGIDADVDEQTEVEKYKQSAYAPLFGKSAISLDEAMRKVEPLWGKAVVVIVDACRVNPIIKNLLKRKISTIRYPAASSQPTNIVYAFATALGEPAPDNGMGQSTLYARTLATIIRTSDGTSTHEEIEQVLSMTKSQVMKDTQRTQIPGKSGELQRPPKFCIKGCPSPIEDWDSVSQQFADAGTHSAFPLRAQAYTQQAPPRSFPRFVKIARMQTDAAARRAQAPHDSRNDDAAPDNPRRRLRVDILYCAGDDATHERASKAAGIKAYLDGLKGQNSPVAGFETGDVKLVAVPPKVNQTLYKANDSAIVYEEGSPALYDWARALRSSVSPPLRLAGKPGSASDYLTLIVCDGASLNVKPATIYIQVASDLQKATAQALQTTLRTAFPNATVPRGIEVIKKSPDLTEVRYFTQAQEADAAQVAGAISEALRTDVKARYIRGYENKLKDSSVIELWLGKKAIPPAPDTSE